MEPTTTTTPHIVSREFDAPRELVWQVSTDPVHMIKWFAPHGMNGFYKNMDFRVGGVFHYGQRSDDGNLTIWGRVSYLEITPMDRMVFLQSFSDENGGLGSHPMAPGWPKTMFCVNTFEDLGDERTRMTINWTPVEGSTAEEIAMFDGLRAGMDQGWKGTLDKLDAYLKTMQP